MNYKTIADVYAANDKIRERLLEVVSNLSGEEENLPSENGKWTLGAIVEHLAKVEGGMMQICHMLLGKAEANGRTGDGSVSLSPSFIEGAAKAQTEQLKFEAPEMVRPEGGKPIADSLQMLAETRRKVNAMRPRFEAVDGTAHTFPHPAFGDLTAHDWLVLIGGHEARHTAQIERILAGAKSEQ
jgi:hypothetical protein